MMLDSSTPQIEWRGQARPFDSSNALSTCVLAPSSTLPRQEFAEDLDNSRSSWDRAHQQDAYSTESDRRLKTVGPKLIRLISRHDEVVLLKKWDGFVLNLLEDGFAVRFEQGTQETESLEAEFALDELADSDKEILAVGMPVVWCISRERANGGQKRCSTIFLRRQPAPREA
jgi:hypothetical protein